MNTTIIIPNFNGSKLLQKNLPQVIAAAKDIEIIVADDASTDESVAILKNEFPIVRIIERPKNEGFASTVNDGVRVASNDLVMLLNSDAYPEKGFLKHALPHFEDPHVFAVGLLQKSIEDGDVVLRGRGVGSFKRGFLIHARGEVDTKNTLWVSGGAGIFRKSIWDELGGMDTLYNPFYWEDIDFSYRALKAGYTLIFEPKSVVVHEQSTGAIRTKYSVSDIKTIAYRNQFLFVWLNISSLKFLLLHKLYVPYHILKAVMRRDTPLLKGFIDALFCLPRVFSSRMKYRRYWKRSDRDIMVQLKP